MGAECARVPCRVHRKVLLATPGVPAQRVRNGQPVSLVDSGHVAGRQVVYSPAGVLAMAVTQKTFDPNPPEVSGWARISMAQKPRWYFYVTLLMVFSGLVYSMRTTLSDGQYYVTVVFLGMAVYAVSMLGSVHDFFDAEHFDASIDARLTRYGWIGCTLVCCVHGFIA